MQSNTEPGQHPAVDFSSISVENRTSDPFTVVNGHHIGHDGFVVPKDFEEFHERFPDYVRQWVRKHSDRLAQPEDLEDWTQDLLIHLRYLPASSKRRQAGKEDIVQTFDPNKQHGANAARFFNYINLCLGNKFRTIRSARLKNPLCRPGKLSLTSHWDGADDNEVGDEFCHSHSEHLRKKCQRQERQRGAREVIAEFSDFVQRQDSSVLPAMVAIAATATPAAAAQWLGITKTDFQRLSNRLRKLGQFFLAGEAPLRRSTMLKPQYGHPCEIAGFQAAQSHTVWNRVELYNEVWNQPLMKLSRKYAISDVRLGKVCRKLRIPHPGRGYWAKRVVGQTVEQVPLPDFKDAPTVRRVKSQQSR